MNLAGTFVIVTGGGNGIGRALCRRFAKEGAAAITVADIDMAAASRVASEIGGRAIAVDVSREPDVARLVKEAHARHGRIDLFARTPASRSTAEKRRQTNCGNGAGTST